MAVNAKKFHNLFLKEIEKSNIESIPWNDSKKWTDKMLKDKNCMMEKIAEKITNQNLGRICTIKV